MNSAKLFVFPLHSPEPAERGASGPEPVGASWKIECAVCGSREVARDEVVDPDSRLHLDLLSCRHCAYQKIAPKTPRPLLRVSSRTDQLSAA